MYFDYFFWDYDGTLFDTYPCVTRAYLKGLKELGIEMDYNELYGLTKISLGYTAKVLSARDGVPSDVILAHYHNHAEDEGYEAMHPYDGARELLEDIISQGGRNYLYTHRNMSGIYALEHHGIDMLFTDYITSENGFPSKPAPDALKFLVGKHNLDLSRCVMLGDREIDVQAGLNAGMDGALFDPDGYYQHAPVKYRFTTMQAIRGAFVRSSK